MKKTLLIILCTAAMAFTSGPESGFIDLIVDPTPANSYATQAGNNLSCYTKAVMALPGASGAFKVGFYLSTDTIIETTDILVGSFNVSGLSSSNPNASGSSVNIDLATKSIPTGSYYVGAFVDYESAVAENGMTPEIDNNGWAFRNGSGVKKVINYPGQDVGILKNDVSQSIQKKYDAEGALVLTNLKGEDISVELYDIQGKLIQKERGASVTLAGRDRSVYLLVVKTLTRTFSEKIIL